MVNGINNELIDLLIKDIGEYADEINNSLNLIDETFSNALDYINCDLTNYLQESYDCLSSNYKDVNSNILSYGIDYAKVKKAYTLRAASIVKQINSIERKQV